MSSDQHHPTPQRHWRRAYHSAVLLAVLLGASGCSGTSEQPAVTSPLDEPSSPRTVVVPIATAAPASEPNGETADDETPEESGQDEPLHGAFDGVEGVPTAIGPPPTVRPPPPVPPAVPAPQSPSARRRARAQARFRVGVEAYTQAKYAKAREHFLAAYQIESRPQVLFNVAMAEWQLGWKQMACKTYARFRAELANRGKRLPPGGGVLDRGCSGP